MTSTNKCPCCASEDFKPMPHAGGAAFVRISVLREEQAKRGHIIVGGPDGFLARVLLCNACGYVGMFHAGEVPEGSGGGTIHIGGGAAIESR
jgi:hypothetical protein